MLRGGKVDLAFTRKDLWVGKVEGVGGEEPFHYGGGGAGFGRFGFRVRLGLAILEGGSDSVLVGQTYLILREGILVE